MIEVAGIADPLPLPNVTGPIWSNIPELLPDVQKILHPQEFQQGKEASQAKIMAKLISLRGDDLIELGSELFGYSRSFTSASAIETIKQILRLQEDTRTLLIAKNVSSSHAMKLLDHLFYVPIVNVSDVQTLCEVTYQTAAGVINTFEELGILQEVTGQKRAKRYAFKEYLGLLSQGAQPL